jgi:hypothetical protein
VLEALKVVNAPVPAVPLPIAPGLAKVAPLKEDAFRFATFVVEDTTRGAVPVDTVDVSCPLTESEVPVAAPMTGVTSVGVLAKTRLPVPVSSVTAVARFALVGVPRKVATPVASPLTPVEIGSPVPFVRVTLVGVPSTGVVNVGEVEKTTFPVPVAPPAVTPPIEIFVPKV